MANEQNKAIVRRMMDLIASGDTSQVDQVFAPNWVNHDPSLPPLQGLDGARQLVQIFHSAYPDGRVTLDNMITEGDKVGGNFSFTGTNTGSFLGLPATSKKVNVQAAGIFRVANGKLTDNWVNLDAMGVMQQLGLASTPGQK